MMNLKSLNWDAEILKEFKINEEILPSIKKSSDFYGHLSLKGLEHVKMTGVIGD